MASMGITFRLFSGFLRLISYVLLPLMNFIYPLEERKHLPRTDNPIFSNSVKEIAIKIRKRNITCVEVIKTFIERLKEVNPFLNAIVEDRFKEALEEAEAVDEFLKSTPLTEDQLKESKPLLGVPVTIKENLSVKGLSLCVGSKKRIGFKAIEDGECVRYLKRAGAIPLCVSNTPEYCLSIETYNLVTGATNNPYDTTRNCGGSSGGEGALVGSGASVCGLGSDIAGSIRIPSAFNGIFGHKPSPGIVTLRGHFPMSNDQRFINHLTLGPLVRYAEDLPLITKILAGDNAKLLNLDEPVNLSKLKVVYMEDCGKEFGLVPVQEDVKIAMRKCVRHLKEECHSNISDVKFKEMEFCAELGTVLHMNLQGVPNVLEHENVAIEILKSFVGKSNYPFNTLLFGIADGNKAQLPGTVEEVAEEIKQLKAKVLAEIGETGVFLWPSFPTSAIPHRGSIYATVGAMYLLIINVLGLPSTNVPVGFDKQGLPIGIQVVAAPNQDRLCFAVAKELEALFGGWKPPY